MSKLAVAVSVPVGTMVVLAEARVLVDGQDLVAAWFPEGYGEDPDVLLGPQGLLQARVEPRRVMIGRPDCDPGCCGSLEVRIRREGDDVVWDHWIAPYVDRAPGGQLRFDAAEYAAELERAHRDRGWEWRGRTVVRLARRLLAEDPALLARMGREPQFVLPWPPPGTDVIQVDVPAPPEQRLDLPRPAPLRFRLDDREPAEQAADLHARLSEY